MPVDEAARQSAWGQGPAGSSSQPLSPAFSSSPPIFPTLPFPPKKFAGSMKSVSFSFTQENQNKRWKMQHLFCLFISLAPVELFGLILILLSRGLSHRETLMGGKGIKLLLILKKNKQKVRDVPDSDLFSRLQEHQKHQVKFFPFLCKFSLKKKYLWIVDLFFSFKTNICFKQPSRHFQRGSSIRDFLSPPCPQN